TSLHTGNAFGQPASRSGVRGRVMGLYVVVMMGGKPLGGPMTGWLADVFTGRAPLVAGGVISMLAAALCAAWVLRRRHRGSTVSARDALANQAASRAPS